MENGSRIESRIALDDELSDRLCLTLTMQDIKNTMKPIKSIVLILSVLFLYCSVTIADDNEYTRETLRGLEGVYVNVLVVDEFKQAGLSEPQVRNDMETKLRTAGIRLVSKYGSFDLPGTTWLSVSVGGSYIKNIKHIPYTIRLALEQDVLIKRSSLSIKAGTWSITKSGIIYRFENLRSKIDDMTNQFINAYLRLTLVPNTVYVQVVELPHPQLWWWY